MTRTLRISILVLVAASAAPRAHAADICGNGIDDDANNLTDEGCWNYSSGQCESPLSCGETGSVSPKKGSLSYSLPPDVAPNVPYGPGIGFRRAYLSQYEPGSAAPVWKKPLGDHWHHTYMTWLAKTGTGSSGVVVLHTSQGQDVRAPWTSTDGTWDYFKPQAGYHVQYMRQRIAAPNEFEIRQLSNSTLIYNSSGRLTEVWDMTGTPNKVLVAYDGNGQVFTVTDASDTRRLRFIYSINRLASLEFQIRIGSDFVTQHTTTYDYNASVSRDSTSNRFVPANATEWTSLLEGSGFSNPGSTWLAQEGSGSLADAFGARTATLTGTASYQQTVSGWTRKGVLVTSGTTSRFSISTPNAQTTSLMLVQYIFTNTTSAGGLNRLGTTQAEGASYFTTGLPVQLRVRAHSGANTASGTINPAGTSLVVTKLDHAANQLVVYTDKGDTLKPTFVNQNADLTSYLLGDASSASNGLMVYGALFTGSAAELSDAQVQQLIKRMNNGPGLASVTIGGQLAQKYVYNAAGDLSKITDAAGNSMMGFGFASATPGQINLIDTPRGVVGFEFNSARAACSGQTVLYFNKGTNTSCSVDGDCGTGFLCGGKTSTGSTGTCFRAARCMTVSSPNEDVVTSVAPLGPPSETCDGACTEISQYVWNTLDGGGQPILDLKATQDPAGNYVTRTFDSNGLVTKMTFGDQDDNPDNGNSSREVYYFYDSLFPGKVKEIRRKSDIDPSAGSCSASVTTGCARTEYTYYPDTGLLKEIKRSGSTLNSSGSVVTFGPLVTTMTYDTKGRVTQIDGPLAGSNDVTVLEYFTASGSNFKEGFLQNYKRKRDASNFITTTVLDYSLWGTPTAVRSPDTDASNATGTMTCLTYSSSRGFLSQRREAMAGQADCSTTNGADITTSWARDSALRLTQLTRADGSCYFYDYDTKGRLLRIKRRDDCNAASAGDKQELVYDADGLINAIQTYDSASTMTAQQSYKYWDSRKLQQITNPVDSTKYTGLVYDNRGLLSQIDGAGNIGKTVFKRDNATAPGRDGRVTSEERHFDNSGTGFDAYALTYSWLGAQTQVTDEDSKATQTVIDDLGRTVKLVSADMSYPTLFLYDDANRMTSKIEAFGGGASQLTHSFTHDNADRRLNTDYAGVCPTGTPQAEVQRVYDAPPVTCPVVGGCLRTGGRLAYVKTKLICSSAYSATDGSWDQQTFYSYDDLSRPVDAGRMIREDIVYDGTLSGPSTLQALQQSAWTKLSRFSQYTSPAGTALGASYNGASSNSDSDQVDFLWRTSSTSHVIENVKWFPFGPLKQYDQMNQIGGLTQQTNISRNSAYRITNVSLRPVTGGAANFQTACVFHGS